MNCPYCNNTETKVYDSRESKDGSSVKRRRECLKCEKRFTTIEKILKLNLDIKKRNNKIEEFNISKIKNSLLKCCEKRPITLEQIETVIEKILDELKKIDEEIIKTSLIGKIVLKILHETDEIAYLRYAIVHNQYENITSFLDEINKIKSFKGLDYK
jgi:transcriptional repressor NrdR